MNPALRPPRRHDSARYPVGRPMKPSAVLTNKGLEGTTISGDDPGNGGRLGLAPVLDALFIRTLLRG